MFFGSLDVDRTGGEVRRVESQLPLPGHHDLGHRELGLGFYSTRRLFFVGQLHAKYRATGVFVNEKLELFV